MQTTVTTANMVRKLNRKNRDTFIGAGAESPLSRLIAMASHCCQSSCPNRPEGWPDFVHWARALGRAHPLCRDTEVCFSYRQTDAIKGEAEAFSSQVGRDRDVR